MSERDGYACPNGHAVDRVRVVNCATCHAGVVYEPSARGMLLLVALARAHAALDAGHDHTPETWADRERWTKRMPR
jgi:hypothetical protein